MNKYTHLIKNVGMLLASNFVTKILSFIMVPLYTSILSTSDYGTADLINNIALLVLPIFSLLMDEAVMRYTLDKATDNRQIFTIASILSTVGFVLLMCISPILLVFETLRPYYWYSVLYYVVSWIYNLTSSYVKGLDKVHIMAIGGIIHTFAYLCLNILFLVALKIGVYGYLLAINISNIIVIFYFIFSCRIYKNFVNFRTINWNLAKEMVRYALPLIPNYISWWINSASDKFIISIFCGTSVNGIYSVAYKIPSLLNSLTTIFSSAWKISSVDDFGSEESIKFYNRIYSFYSGILLMGAAGLILSSRFIARILFAKDFFAAWEITPILVIAYLFNALAQHVSSIFSASKQTKKIFYASLTGALVNLLLNLILIPKYQGSGAAIATVIGYMVVWIINMINTRNILSMDFNLKKIVSSTIILVIEIVFILLNDKKYYLFSIFCVFGVLFINRKELVNVFEYLKRLKVKKMF